MFKLTKKDQNEEENEEIEEGKKIKKITEQNPKSLSFSGKNTHFICSFCS